MKTIPISNTKGFTLIELMIVVAIIGLLAAIAVPAYAGYIKTSKITSLTEHQATAIRVVKSEAAKVAAGSIGNNVVSELNFGERKAVGNPSLNAFIASNAPEAGQIGISGLDGTNRPAPGNVITIAISPVEGTETADYGVPLTVSFLIE